MGAETGSLIPSLYLKQFRRGLCRDVRLFGVRAGSSCGERAGTQALEHRRSAALQRHIDAQGKAAPQLTGLRKHPMNSYRVLMGNQTPKLFKVSTLLVPTSEKTEMKVTPNRIFHLPS